MYKSKGEISVYGHICKGIKICGNSVDIKKLNNLSGLLINNIIFSKLSKKWQENIKISR